MDRRGVVHDSHTTRAHAPWTPPRCVWLDVGINAQGLLDDTGQGVAPVSRVGVHRDGGDLGRPASA